MMETLKPRHTFYTDPEQLDSEYCSVSECSECDGTDMNGEPNGYGCTARDNWVEKHLHLVHDEEVEIITHIRNIESKLSQAVDALEEIDKHNTKIHGMTLEIRKHRELNFGSTKRAEEDRIWNLGRKIKDRVIYIERKIKSLTSVSETPECVPETKEEE